MSFITNKVVLDEISGRIVANQRRIDQAIAGINQAVGDALLCQTAYTEALKGISDDATAAPTKTLSLFQTEWRDSALADLQALVERAQAIKEAVSNVK